MADYSPTATDVKVISGFSGSGVLAESCAAGDLLIYDETLQTWSKVTNDGASTRTGISLQSGAIGQTVPIMSQKGAVLNFGDGLFDEGEIVVASPNNDGKLAPYSDLDVPAGDYLFIVGYTNRRGRLVVMLEYTDVTALEAALGDADITLGALTLESAGTVTVFGESDITLGTLTLESAGTVA